MVKDHEIKSNSGRKGLLHFLSLRPYSITEEAMAGTQGRNLKAGSKAKTMEKCCLLACLAGLFSTTYSGMYPPTSIIHTHKDGPQICLQASMMGHFLK